MGAVRGVAWSLVLLLACAGGVAGQGRLDPALRLTLQLERAGIPAVTPRPERREPGAPASTPLPMAPVAPPGLAVAAESAPGGLPAVRALVRVDSGGVEALQRAGARVGVRAGGVVTAWVPVRSVPTLLEDPSILYIESADLLETGWLPPVVGRPRSGLPGRAGSAHRWLALGDVATPDAGLSRLRQRVGSTFHGLTGRGVIIGIVDTGIDLDHPDFRGPDGRTRVLYAWDQSAEQGRPPGAIPNGVLDYGHECDRAEIDGGVCPMVDRSGHGTHVAGIAAGNGSATGAGQAAYRFIGAAPEADLIIVKGGDNSIPADRIVDGVAYIFARAAELGRPAVVNLSVSTQSGPHDGTTLLEQALNALAGPGRILVSVAGNQGVNANEFPAYVRAPVHAMGSVLNGMRSEHAVVVPPYEAKPGPFENGAALELWYDGRDSLAVVVTTPAGEQIRVATGDTALVTTASGGVYVANAPDGPEAINGDHLAMIVLFDPEPGMAPASGRWLVAVEGDRVHAGGAYHLWLVGSTMTSATELTKLEGGTANSHLVPSPGTADRVIAVGAYATRHRWPGVDGAPAAFPFQEPLGDIAFFSGPGPRRDGVLKPELAAPGKMVISSRAAQGALWDEFPNFVESDGVHAALLGTSMASPYVAGVVALLLQLSPNLMPEAVRGILAASARRDDFTARPGPGEPPAVPNRLWGYGKLDAERAVWSFGLAAAELEVEAEAVPAAGYTSAQGTRLPLMRLRFRAGPEEAVAVEELVFDLAGVDPGAEARLVLDLNRNGVADPDEPVAGSVSAPLSGAPRRVSVNPGPVVPAGLEQDYLLVLELSGASPNRTTFSAVYRGELTRTRGTLSGRPDRIRGAAPTFASGPRSTTLLEEGERLNFSANPVRGDELVINYSERPRAITIYTLTGARVYRFGDAELHDGHALWPLVNDRGEPVANGTYLVVVDFPGERSVTKLFVLRP